MDVTEVLNHIEHINYLAVICAASSAFLLGGFWYSPKVFGRKWMREIGMRESYKKNGHGPFVFLLAFIMSVVAAATFSFFLGSHPSITKSLGTGLLIGVGWVFTSFSINYLFAGRSHKLLFIDGSYHIAQFLLYALILWVWP